MKHYHVGLPRYETIVLVKTLLSEPIGYHRLMVHNLNVVFFSDNQKCGSSCSYYSYKNNGAFMNLREYSNRRVLQLPELVRHVVYSLCLSGNLEFMY
jgi:hypothetical protein